MENPSDRCRLYRLLLQKYAAVITEKERRTIGAVKALLDSNDLTIQSLVETVRSNSYAFSRDYPAAAQRLFDFVSTEIAFVKCDIPISFWLSPKEILEHKIADDEDHAVFLCSLLLGLGDEKAQVIIAELTDLTTHAFVFTEVENTYWLLDSTQPDLGILKGSKEEVLSRYHVNSARIKRFLYKFNRSNYEQFL